MISNLRPDQCWGFTIFIVAGPGFIWFIMVGRELMFENPDLCQLVFIQWLGLLWGVLWVADWANVKGLLM